MSRISRSPQGEGTPDDVEGHSKRYAGVDPEAEAGDDVEGHGRRLNAGVDPEAEGDTGEDVEGHHLARG